MFKKIASCLFFTVSISYSHSSFGKCIKDQKYGYICDTVFKTDWWVGSWMSEESDQCGNDLITFIYLTKDGKFLKHLVSKDHRTRDVWGSYKIILSSPEQAGGKEYVPWRRSEMRDLNAFLATTARYDRNASSFYRFAEKKKSVSSPYPQSGLMNTLYGTIMFSVKGQSPKDYEVGDSQTYSFKTQGNEFIQVSGPGVTEGLMRKFSDAMLNSVHQR